MPFADNSPHHSWRAKFACAFVGLRRAIRTQVSFLVHILAAAVVVVIATLLKCTLTEWGLLLLCITGVLTAEVFNTALERLAKAITTNYDPNIGDALDIASAAVLLAAIGSGIVGLAIFINRLALLLGWWTN
jgi:diacylglycerol kinase